MKTYISNSGSETKKFAEKLAEKYRKNGGIFALTGDLGAGKTTFAQGFAKGLNIKDKIISPTFVLTRQHKIPDASSMLYHLDLYRLETTSDIRVLGIEELLIPSKNILLIEWPEKLEKILPKSTIRIQIVKLEGNKRKIIIS